MKYDVDVTTVNRQLIAASRQRTTYKRISQEIGDLLGYAWKLIREHPELRTKENNSGHNVAIYWGAPPDGSIEVGVQVVSGFEETPDVVCSATPAGRAATTAHYGRYDQLGAAHDAVREWCAKSNREHGLPFWEIYGDWNDDWAKVRTDVYYLIK